MLPLSESKCHTLLCPVRDIFFGTLCVTSWRRRVCGIQASVCHDLPLSTVSHSSSSFLFVSYNRIFFPGNVRRYFHSDMFIQGSCLGVCPSIRMTSIIHALAATKQTLSPRYNEKWIPTLSLFSQALPIYYQDCKALPIYDQDSVKLYLFITRTL